MASSHGQVANFSSRRLKTVTILPEWGATLTQLNLSHNAMESLPDGVLQLWRLQKLNVSSNQLPALPDSIDRLKELKWLNVAGNRLVRLPGTLGNLVTLLHLDLSQNQLTDAGLPDTFFGLVELRRLYLSDNCLQRLHCGFCKLTNLQVLAVRDNQVKEMSEQIFHLVHLRELHLQGNQLKLLPPSLGRISPLSGSNGVLRLQNNPLVRQLLDQLILGQHHHLLEYIAGYRYSMIHKALHKPDESTEA